MNKELKRVSTVVLVMFLALFLSGTVIQVFAADGLRADGRNSRTLFASYSIDRGPILVNGEAIAESVPVDDEYKFQRTYPGGLLYAPITGYFTLNQGTTGLESELNDYLSGTANEQFFDQLNGIITGKQPEGAAVETTIDPVVQQAAWDALGENSGAVIAIDPKTGAILAMVSKPTYDPNALAGRDTDAVIAAYDQLVNDPAGPLFNRAIAGNLNPPGSVFKVLMTAAAIDSGMFTPDSEFPNPSELALPQSGSVVTNAEGGSCGGGATASLATGLRLSCNITFAQLGAALGENVIRETAEKFGFEQSVNIPMASEPSVFPRTGGDQATLMLSSFGQASVRMSPLQVAMISMGIANGGAVMQPTLVESITAPDLTVIQEFEPKVFSQAIKPETAATMTQLMVQNVSNGAGSNARIDGVEVAGKTGTAENGEGEPFTLWFTGFAPANDPRVAVAVVVENGGGFGQSAFGNQVAAPIAKKVLEAVLFR